MAHISWEAVLEYLAEKHGDDDEAIRIEEETILCQMTEALS